MQGGGDPDTFAPLFSLLVSGFHLLCLSKEMRNCRLPLLVTPSVLQLSCLPCREELAIPMIKHAIKT